jgi:hypothetical protein
MSAELVIFGRTGDCCGDRGCIVDNGMPASLIRLSEKTLEDLLREHDAAGLFPEEIPQPILPPPPSLPNRVRTARQRLDNHCKCWGWQASSVLWVRRESYRMRTWRTEPVARIGARGPASAGIARGFATDEIGS